MKKLTKIKTHTKRRMVSNFFVVILITIVPMLRSSCTIRTKSELSVHLDDWIEDPSASRHVCGDIIYWDVREITDLSYLFCALNTTWAPKDCNTNRQSFNADISRWNIAKVTSMEGTFLGADSFDISRTWFHHSLENHSEYLNYLTHLK